MSLISFVIPCYRSEHTIESVVDEIGRTMREHPEDSFEVILVDDCSPDSTFGVIRRLCAENSNITGLSFAKNFGQHAALMAGFAHVHGDIIVCLDDDGQTPADQVYRLIDKLNEGYDAVYAAYPEKKHTLFRNLGSDINKVMTEVLLDKPKDLYQSSYFATRRFVIDEMLHYQNPYPYAMGLVLRTTGRVTNVPVDHRDRLEGSTGYTLKKLVNLLANGFTAFSVKPLRIATIMGLVISCLGLLYIVFAVINKFVNPRAPLGWTTLIVVILLIGGMILCVLGLIGEYIGRIYICLNRSPQYVVRELIERDTTVTG